MSGFIFEHPVYQYDASNDKDIVIYDDLKCAGEDYLVDGPHVEGYAVGYNWRSYHMVYETVDEGCFVFESSTTGRYAFVVPGHSYSDGRFILVDSDARSNNYYGLLNFKFHYRDFDDPDYGSVQTSGQFPDSIGTYDGHDTHADFASNVPIFKYEDYEQAQLYVKQTTAAGADSILKEYALNYGAEPAVLDDSTKEYYIYNRYKECEVSRGIVSVTGNRDYQANEKILYNGHNICLYRDGTNPFKLSIKFDSDLLLGSIYSDTSVEEVANADYSVYEEDMEYTTPFYSEYKSGLGLVDYTGYLGTLSTNLPIWDTEADADLFMAGDKNITEASNWDTISGGGAYNDIITNLTELPEEETEFGEVKTRNFFSQMYLCNVSALQAISNSLFDYDVTTLTGMWEDIKKGLEMYGTDPMQVVQGLRFYPFDLTNIFNDVQPQQYIYFGAYQLSLTGSVYKIIYANGYKDLGSVTIKRTFKDWRDFEPYTRLSIYLPYVGRYQLDLKKYYDKTVNVRYYIDIRTGACCACLIANGILLDWFDGVIGTEMPITLTDYSSYAQSQLSIIMRNAGMGAVGEAATLAAGHKVLKGQMARDTLDGAVATREAGNFASLKSQTAMSAGASTALAGAAGGVAIAGVAAMTIMKTQFEMLQNGTSAYTKTRPGSSAMINQFLPQYPTFMFEIQEIDESEYLNELYGRPSNASGRIGDFSGYLEAEDVMLICPIATDNERQEIIDLVKNGIYL